MPGVGKQKDLGKLKAIKKFLILVLLIAVGLVILVSISLQGEREYLKNCETLGIRCEPGSVHAATGYLIDKSRGFWTWLRIRSAAWEQKTDPDLLDASEPPR